MLASLFSSIILFHLSICVCVCLLSTGKAVIMCQSSKKEFFKKFLYEPLPVEVRITDKVAMNNNVMCIALTGARYMHLVQTNMLLDFFIISHHIILTACWTAQNSPQYLHQHTVTDNSSNKMSLHPSYGVYSSQYPTALPVLIVGSSIRSSPLEFSVWPVILNNFQVIRLVYCSTIFGKLSALSLTLTTIWPETSLSIAYWITLYSVCIWETQ